MNKIFVLVFLLFLLLLITLLFLNKSSTRVEKTASRIQTTGTNPLMISQMRKRSYPGSPIIKEQTLPPNDNYNSYIASYKSDGLKIYALLTVPIGVKPKNGWPVILFNHGYIPPTQYRTRERYVAYVDAFAKNGYIVFKPDYRGNGSSEGKPEGAYYSPAYTVDDLNALSSLRRYKDVNPNKIGVWGHSMGGNITLRDLVVEPKWIQAAVIWGGVVGSYKDLLSWHDPTYHPSGGEGILRVRTHSQLSKQYGTPDTNPAFWHSIDPTYNLADISAPIQLHHGESDIEVPLEFSFSLYDKLKKAGKTVEFYSYPGADHNISDPSFSLAIERSISFFNKYLKNK